MHSDKGYKYFIGYKPDNIIRPLPIILPQISGYINCFDNNRKVTEDDIVLLKYNEIWNKVKKTLNVEFHSEPVYGKKYIKI